MENKDRNESADEMLAEEHQAGVEADGDVAAMVPLDESASTDTETDTEPEVTTDESDTETETVERTPEEQLFYDEGLDKQYSTPLDVIRRAKEQNRHLTQISQERADLLRQLETSRETKREDPAIQSISNEEFLEDPSGAMARSGYIKQEDVSAMVQKQVFKALDDDKAEEFEKNTSDFADLRPTMTRLYNENPELDHMPRAAAIRVLYKLAKAEQLPAAVDTSAAVLKADADKKARATTSGGRSPGQKSERTVEDFEQMPVDQLEKELGFDG